MNWQNKKIEIVLIKIIMKDKWNNYKKLSNN